VAENKKGQENVTNHEEHGPPGNLENNNGVGTIEEDSEITSDEIESLRKEFESTRDKMLRIAAEAENFKKRMERERENLLKYAGENIFRELLTTLDNLDRAMEQAGGNTEDAQKKLNAMLEGLELTRKGLMATLEKFEVTPIECVGQEFNPNEHEAMTMEPSEEIPANHILNEFIKGYKFKDRLLRAAKVIVSSGPAH